MTRKLIVPVIVATMLLGCRFSAPGHLDETGALSISLPAIASRSALPDASDVARFEIEVKSDTVGYAETFQSTTGGVITIGRLAEATYSILVEALDSDGNVIMRGSDTADVFVGEVTFLRIELEHTAGYLEIEVTLPGRDTVALLEIGDISFDNAVPISVVHGPGLFIERLFGGLGTYTPGLASMKVFSIETTGVNAQNLQAWFDQPGEGRTGVLIVTDLQRNVAYRWIMTNMTPRRYQTDANGETQFYFSVDRYELTDLTAELVTNYNDATDKIVEIGGIGTFAPEVYDDEGDKTLTLEFGFEFGLYEMYLWIDDLVDGIGEKRSVVVSTFAPGNLSEPIDRQNYSGVFPIRFEQVDGFGTSVNGKYRVVLSYDEAENAL
jgi:hypothetical protein